MNGITSQLLSLITYGNYFVKTGQLSGNYYPDNVAFKFCNKIDFLYLSTLAEAAKEEVVAANPADWFKLLKQEGCRQLKVYYHPSDGNQGGTPDHKLAGFVGGGGTWLIEVIYPSHSDFWANRWKVTQPDDPERKIWSVSYGRTVTGAATINFCPDPVQVRQGLHNILIDIKSFALQHHLNNWANIFQGALDVLIGPAPLNDWFANQINENGYDSAVLRLIYGAMTADVFGGMGSWNDLGFENLEDNQRYNELSFHLYDYINRALISGINSIN